MKAAASQIPPEARLSILGRITTVLHEGFEIPPERTTTVRIRFWSYLPSIILLHESHVVLTIRNIPLSFLLQLFEELPMENIGVGAHIAVFVKTPREV